MLLLSMHAGTGGQGPLQQQQQQQHTVHCSCKHHMYLCYVYALQDALDACNGWEVDRQVEQAMDALRYEKTTWLWAQPP